MLQICTKNIIGFHNFFFDLDFFSFAQKRSQELKFKVKIITTIIGMLNI